MWRWDQGRLDYFQFDTIRAIATFAVEHDLKNCDPTELRAVVQLPFSPDDDRYHPWRNYGRTFKTCFLVAERGNMAEATPVAALLAVPGTVTADEYFHFLLQATADPTPAYANWNPNGNRRFPLLFCLKYILCNSATGKTETSLAELIGAYSRSALTGAESQEAFLEVTAVADANLKAFERLEATPRRQSLESLKVISQISYLHLSGNQIFTTLAAPDASSIFDDLAPIGFTGVRADANEELRRIAGYFKGGSSNEPFEYESSISSIEIESGFSEGGRIRKSHIVIERNSKLRQAFFATRSVSTCDMCRMNPETIYPWTKNLLELHHLLPLASGTRVTVAGTVLDDLVAICPSCHRAIHRYYDTWLRQRDVNDFASLAEARTAYKEAQQRVKEVLDA